jgi:hypothetical protein
MGPCIRLSTVGLSCVALSDRSLKPCRYCERKSRIPEIVRKAQRSKRVVIEGSIMPVSGSHLGIKPRLAQVIPRSANSMCNALRKNPEHAYAKSSGFFAGRHLRWRDVPYRPSSNDLVVD